MTHKNKLPNTLTSDQQLLQWGKEHIPGFKSVISATDFPKLYPTLLPGDSIIINLDPEYSRGGSHWVALRVSSEAPIVYYKDSFGAPPPDIIIGAIKDRGLVYGNRINQALNEENCGKRAAEFLRKMSRAAGKKNEIEYFESLED